MFKKTMLIVSSIILFNVAFATPIPKIYEPFAPLSVDELIKMVNVVKQAPQYSKNLLFSLVVPVEPTKSTDHATQPVFHRQALVTLFNPKNNHVYEALVDITQPKLISWQEVLNAQPIAGLYDYNLLPKLLKSNSNWIQALKKRGITDLDKVYIDLWMQEASDDPALKNHRLVRALPFYMADTSYMYGRPIEGLGASVDLTTQKVTVIDTGIIPLAKNDSAYDIHSVGPLRKPPNYLEIQPKPGVSFHLQGHELTWQNWRFTISFNPRDGIVLKNIAYFDHNQWRSILDSISLSEIAVPYGDPDPQWSWRHALDASEYGLGFMSTPLEKETDVPAYTVFLDMPIVTQEGHIQTLPHVAGIYENYGGFIWKHFDSNITNTNTSRRAQNLVISSATTIANYDYVISYIFRQDASIEVKVLSTGIMLPKGVDQSHHNQAEHLVTEQIAAPHHQHFFNFRLDFNVNGRQNWLFEENTIPIAKGPGNPRGNAFVPVKTLLKNSLEARRNINPTSSRFWVVTNPHVQNSLGQPVGYALLPGNNTVPYAQPNSTWRQRVGFVSYHLWATPYHPLQMNALGRYPVLSAKPNGVAQWAKANHSLKDTHIVLWYTMGFTHIPRPEEWPVMPTSEISFKLIPYSFFNRNPAINMP